MPDNHLTLEVMGADGEILFVNNITSINVRMENGVLLGFRPGHAPLIGIATAGILKYKSEGEWNQAEIDAGILSIEKNKVRILTAGSV